MCQLLIYQNILIVLIFQLLINYMVQYFVPWASHDQEVANRQDQSLQVSHANVTSIEANT